MRTPAQKTSLLLPGLQPVAAQPFDIPELSLTSAGVALNWSRRVLVSGLLAWAGSFVLAALNLAQGGEGGFCVAVKPYGFVGA